MLKRNWGNLITPIQIQNYLCQSFILFSAMNIYQPSGCPYGTTD
jgi:hypothetical protein